MWGIIFKEYHKSTVYQKLNISLDYFLYIGIHLLKILSLKFPILIRNIEVLNEWNVIKFANGLVIATLERNLGSIALTLSTGNIYTNISHSGVSIPLPNDIFKKILSSSMNVQTDGYTLCQISSVSISYVTYRIWSPYSTTLSQCIASWMVVGMWK